MTSIDEFLLTHLKPHTDATQYIADSQGVYQLLTYLKQVFEPLDHVTLYCPPVTVVDSAVTAENDDPDFKLDWDADYGTLSVPADFMITLTFAPLDTACVCW